MNKNVNKAYIKVCIACLIKLFQNIKTLLCRYFFLSIYANIRIYFLVFLSILLKKNPYSFSMGNFDRNFLYKGCLLFILN